LRQFTGKSQAYGGACGKLSDSIGRKYLHKPGGFNATLAE